MLHLFDDCILIFYRFHWAHPLRYRFHVFIDGCHSGCYVVVLFVIPKYDIIVHGHVIWVHSDPFLRFLTLNFLKLLKIIRQLFILILHNLKLQPHPKILLVFHPFIKLHQNTFQLILLSLYLFLIIWCLLDYLVDFVICLIFFVVL